MLNRQQAINFLLKSPYKLGHMLGFTKLTPLNNQWICDMIKSKNSKTLQAHRGSYKTTCVSIALAILILLYPKKKILFLRKTDEDVKEIISQVKKILMSEHFQVFALSIWGVRISLTIDNATMIDTNLNDDIKVGAQLTSFGCKVITGKHYDIIFTDDIVNLLDRVSRAERCHTILIYQELQNIINPGGRFFNTGTPWHKDDAFVLMPNIERYDCYSTGLITPQKIKELRSSMTPSLFAANYELKHIADKNAMFTEPHFTEDYELLFNGISQIDAAYGGDDYTAYTAFKEQPDGTIIGLGKIWQQHVDDCLGEIAAYHEEYRLGTVHCERNGDKGYLAKELRSNGLPCDSYAEKMNKFIKISTYLKANWSRILWLDKTDPEYLAQILDYTEQAAHDDAPDSAASLLRILSTDNEGINLFREGF